MSQMRASHRGGPRLARPTHIRTTYQHAGRTKNGLRTGRAPSYFDALAVIAGNSYSTDTFGVDPFHGRACRITHGLAWSRTRRARIIRWPICCPGTGAAILRGQEYCHGQEMLAVGSGSRFVHNGRVPVCSGELVSPRHGSATTDTSTAIRPLYRRGIRTRGRRRSSIGI